GKRRYRGLGPVNENGVISQKGIAEKLGVPNARISEIEGEKRLCPGIRAEYDRLLSVLLENQIQA
uniref:hypothetical protein n=1 Tax=Alkalibaculum bacchi TaxID=645887 RepID=UPI0026E9E0A5